MLVSVLVVNYNGRYFLNACLSSLESQVIPRGEFEVLLIDNGSSDGSVEFVREHFPNVRVITLTENVGFAAANVIGLQNARGRFIALLNNDATADPSWLAEMLSSIDADSKIGGVTAKIVFAHNSSVINSAGLVLYRDGRGGDRGFRCDDGPQFAEPAEVFGACGAGVLYRREMLEAIGFFEPRFFMYYEDLDLAWRAQRHGWRFVYAPKAVVRHVHCGSSGEWSPAFCFYVERNRALTSVRNGSIVLALWSCIGLVLRSVRCWLRIPFSRQWQVAHGWAYVRAVASMAAELPAALAARRRHRPTHDHARRYERLIESAPAKAA